MQKKDIVKKVTPLLDKSLSEIQKKDILAYRKDINCAIALFTQELENCSLSGQVVLNSARYGELLMYTLHSSNYSLFTTVVELLQWHIWEQSPHTGFLWAMTVLLERIHELDLFEEILDMGIVNDTLVKINRPAPAKKKKAKTSKAAKKSEKPAPKKAAPTKVNAKVKAAPAKKKAKKAKPAAKKAKAK
ncbi:MAG: hypothetical protein J5553_05045 [Verrucomicrobia bacterium]|nr:hypothetical protein [Verrucomicrobiota bacterium]